MDELKTSGVYTIECRDADGNLKWSETANNVVTNQGRNAMLDNYFTQATGNPFYLSLITAGTATTGSTYASPTVTEIGAGIVTGNTRPALSSAWAAASGGAKAFTSPVTFTITGTATVTGNMLVAGSTGASTVGNTAATGGVLYSAANFTGGSKSVSSGDSLSVSYTTTLT